MAAPKTDFRLLGSVWWLPVLLGGERTGVVVGVIPLAFKLGHKVSASEGVQIDILNGASSCLSNPVLAIRPR
jgi:hypothetical protein